MKNVSYWRRVGCLLFWLTFWGAPISFQAIGSFGVVGVFRMEANDAPIYLFSQSFKMGMYLLHERF